MIHILDISMNFYSITSNCAKSKMQGFTLSTLINYFINSNKEKNISPLE